MHSGVKKYLYFKHIFYTSYFLCFLPNNILRTVFFKMIAILTITYSTDTTIWETEPAEVRSLRSVAEYKTLDKLKNKIMVK